MRYAGFIGLALALGGCVESYLPDVVSAPNSYLVVDGFINGAGRTRVRLSRSENIAAAATPPAEKGAKLLIQDNTGLRYSLAEVSSGYYVSDSLRLDPTRQYQLRISTAAKADYASDLVPLKATPPIDKLTYQAANDEVSFTLDAHDASGQSRYYRWRYAETWEFHVPYHSDIEFRGGIIQSRITPIYTCWHTEQPSSIIQSTTASLSQDVVQGRVLLHPSARSERFKIRYSLLVTQYAETAEEFAYNEVLRKNTEAVGTINDPLPSQLTGNVHRLSDPAEPVLGFVSAHTLVVQRIFVTPQDLPAQPPGYFEDPYAGCPEPDTVRAEILYPYFKYGVPYPQTRLFSDPDNVPTNYLYGPIYGYPILGYAGGKRACLDCRVRGSNMKPSFW